MWANLCVLQAPHGRGSWNSESQGASATRAAAREFTETYQIQKGSVTIYTTLQWVTYVVPTRRQSCARKADNYVFVACAEPAYDGVNFRASTEGNLSSLHVRPVISLAVHQMDLVCSKPCECCECTVTSTRSAGEVPAGGEQDSAEGGRHSYGCWLLNPLPRPCSSSSIVFPWRKLNWQKALLLLPCSPQRSRKLSDSKRNGTRINNKQARLPRPSWWEKLPQQQISGRSHHTPIPK